MFPWYNRLSAWLISPCASVRLLVVSEKLSRRMVSPQNGLPSKLSPWTVRSKIIGPPGQNIAAIPGPPYPNRYVYIHSRVEKWTRASAAREKILRHMHELLTGTTIAGSGGSVCSSVDTGWYSGTFESMVVSLLIQSQSVNYADRIAE